MFHHIFDPFSTGEHPTTWNLTNHEREVHSAIAGKGMGLTLPSEIHI